MTREEAVNTLGNFKRYISGGGVTDLKANEAIDMAIEALQTPPISQRSMYQAGYRQAQSDAIEAIELVDWYHQNSNKDMVHGANDDEHQAWYKADDVYKALEAIPSANRQMVIKCKPFLSEEDFKAFAEQASDQNVILISNEAEVVSTNTSTNTSTKSTNISIDAPADRPRGEWVEQEDDYHHYWECSECGMGVGLDDIRNFCPNCGADMRGEDE